MTVTHLPTLLRVDSDLVCAKATNVILGPDFEHVDVGPFAGSYVSFYAPDLVVAVSYARRLLDEIESVVLDARQDAAEAERHGCPGCGTALEADEITCGSPHCGLLYYHAEDGT